MAADSELAAVRDAAHELLDRHAGSARIRSMLSDPLGDDPQLWRRMADLGWAGVEIGAEHGGMGLGCDYLAVLLEELGRSVAGGPFLASAGLATPALLMHGTKAQQDEWLPAFAAGSRRGALVASGMFGSAEQPILARADGGRLSLHGRAEMVLGAGTADLLVVAAVRDRRPVLLALPAGVAGLTIQPTPTLDLTRGFAAVSFDGVSVPDLAVMQLADGVDPFGPLASRARIAIAWDSLGVAQRALAMTVDYAKSRQQFGRPIGSFQAVKHQCADVYVGVEVARALAEAATDAASRRAADAASLSAMAKARACSVASDATGRGIQLHGGIGYTWEHDMHLYFKRAHVNESIFGDRRWNLRLSADLTF